MTNILINSEKIPVTFDSKMVISELLSRIECNVLGNTTQTITDVLLDQSSIHNSSSQVYKKTIENFNEIKIETKDKYDLAFDTLKTLELHTDFTIKKIEKIIPLLRKNKKIEANENIVQLIDFIDIFLNSLKTIINTLQPFIQKLNISDEIGILEKETLKTVKKILDSQENCNYVHLADLYEYELKENLKAWNEKVIINLLVEAHKK